MDTVTAVPEKGSVQQLVDKGTLAATEVNPLLTEGQNECESMAEDLPTTHKERNDVVCLMITIMLKEML